MIRTVVHDGETVLCDGKRQRRDSSLQNVDSQDVQSVQCITTPQPHMRVNVVCFHLRVTGTTLSCCYGDFVWMHSYAET